MSFLGDSGLGILPVPSGDISPLLLRPSVRFAQITVTA